LTPVHTSVVLICDVDIPAEFDQDDVLRVLLVIH